MPASPVAQSADTVLMIRPQAFYPNAETAADNHFQGTLAEVTGAELLARAQAESDALAAALSTAGVNVLVIASRAEDDTPDALFPNNWFTTHADGRIALYPMSTPNRRRERRADVLAALSERYGFRVAGITDFSALENEGVYLEGTGSLLIDRPGGVVYVCRSARSHPRGIAQVSATLGLRPVVFGALDATGFPIYHTNVMLALGTGFAIVCLEAVADAAERRALREELLRGGRELIEITHAQVGEFAGNALEVRGNGQAWLAMSERARAAFDPAQRARIERHARILAVPIPVIETIGGGGVRCMLAEIFLPRA